MGGITLVGATDVVRAFGPNIDAATPLSIKKWLERHRLAQSGAGFNYDPSIKGMAEVLRGRRTFDAARAAVAVGGRPCGRPYNVAVFDALEPYLLAHQGPAYPIPYTAVKIGSPGGVDVHIGLKAPIVRVFEGEPRIVYPAFRSSYLPTWQQAGFEASIAQAYLAQDDFYGVSKFEYVCVRSMKSALDRHCRVLTEGELQLLPSDKVNRLLSLYMAAVAMLIEEGKGSRPSAMSGYHIVDPDVGDFFR